MQSLDLRCESTHFIDDDDLIAILELTPDLRELRGDVTNAWLLRLTVSYPPEKPILVPKLEHIMLDIDCDEDDFPFEEFLAMIRSRWRIDRTGCRPGDAVVQQFRSVYILTILDNFMGLRDPSRVSAGRFGSGHQHNLNDERTSESKIKGCFPVMVSNIPIIFC